MRQKSKDFIIHPIPVLLDNIIWILAKGNQAMVVDPAISKPVIKWLKTKNLTLESILQTHHHEDHIGGTEELLKVWPSAKVIAAKKDLARIPFQTHSVIDNDTLILLEEEVKVLEVPGHTSNHVSYFINKAKGTKGNPVLFCGDTLFGGGCGRLFEGSPQEMFSSLKRLQNLPVNTEVYCAHEYTEENLIWAQSICPKDLGIQERLKIVQDLRNKGFPSLPSSILEERETNLFLRAKTPNEFSKLRLHKDKWKI